MDIIEEIKAIKERLNRLETALMLGGGHGPLDEEYTPTKTWFPELDKSEEDEMVFKSKIEQMNHD